jgi:hypothetical protein
MAHRGRKTADEALQAALVAGATVQGAAAVAGISESTAHRRLQDPQFRHALQEARSDMVQRTASMLTSAAVEAVETLRSLQAADVSPAVRLGAARSIIELGTRLRDSTEFEARLTALEAQQRRKECYHDALEPVAQPGTQDGH